MSNKSWKFTFTLLLTLCLVVRALVEPADLAELPFNDAPS